MAKDNFFKELNYLEKRVILENKKETEVGITSFSEVTFQNLSLFLRFIEEGRWTRSEHTKFIARHYKYPQSELPDLYFSATGKRKSASTFRNQHQKISDELYAYFGKDFAQAFLQENEKAMQDIISKTTVLSVGDVYFEDLFGTDIAEYITSKSSGLQRYNISECSDEVNALISLSKTNISNILGSLDIDKLNYLMSIFHRPLIEQGVLNKDKLNVLTCYADAISNSKVIENRINSRRGIEYDEVVFDEETVGAVKDNSILSDEDEIQTEDETTSSSTNLSDDEYARATTRVYGDVSFPILNADFFEELTEGYEEKIPSKEDFDEVLTIVYLIHFYQVGFFKRVFMECDPSLLKYVINKLRGINDDGSPDLDSKSIDKVYNMLDGYDIMNKEFNIVASRSLNVLQKSSKVSEAKYEEILNKHKGLEGYKAGVISYYYKDNDISYKAEAEKYVAEFGLTRDEVNNILNYSIEPFDVDRIITKTSINNLYKNKGYDFTVEFLENVIKGVKDMKDADDLKKEGSK